MNAEKIIGIVPNLNKKKGWFSWQTFNLVLTDRRVIAAELTSDMIKAEAAKKSREAKEQGFLKQMISTAFSGYGIYQRYYTMQPDAILSENAGNYALDIARIKSLEVKHKHYERDNKHYDETELLIKADSGKYSFKAVAGGMSAADMKSLLRQAYPGKMK